jgi:hypothetical protein
VPLPQSIGRNANVETASNPGVIPQQSQSRPESLHPVRGATPPQCDGSSLPEVPWTSNWPNGPSSLGGQYYSCDPNLATFGCVTPTHPLARGAKTQHQSRQCPQLKSKWFFSPSALDGLSRRERFTDTDDLVFVDELGGHVDDWRLRRRFHAALERAGLPRLRLHDLRHTFGTIAVQVFPLTGVKGYMGTPTSKRR